MNANLWFDDGGMWKFKDVSKDCFNRVMSKPEFFVQGVKSVFFYDETDGPIVPIGFREKGKKAEFYTKGGC